MLNAQHQSPLGQRNAVMQSGTVLAGRYRLGVELGRGGTGIVHQAQHIYCGRQVALKLMNPEYVRSLVAQARFRQEAEIGGELVSPWTVPVIDFDIHEGCPFLVMELLQGRPLSNAFRESVGETASRRMQRLLPPVLDACKGLAHAHSMGIVHRDIKPANIFLSEQASQIVGRLLDFGVAKRIHTPDETARDPMTSAGGIVGTVAYMAPEQLRGEPVDATTDVYAIGVVLYECLTGSRPFTGQDERSLMYQILEQRLPPLPDATFGCSRQILRCIERAMKRDSSARFSSVDELAQELESALRSARALTARAITPGGRTSRRLGWAGGAVVGALCMAGWSLRHSILDGDVNLPVRNGSTDEVASFASSPNVEALAPSEQLPAPTKSKISASPAPTLPFPNAPPARVKQRAAKSVPSPAETIRARPRELVLQSRATDGLQFDSTNPYRERNNTDVSQVLR